MTIHEVRIMREKLDDQGRDPYLTEKKMGDTARFAEGVALIAKYSPRESFSFKHDEAFFAFSEEMTEAEVLRMYQLGFHLDSSVGCWAKFS
jgi:hypothetical protein